MDIIIKSKSENKISQDPPILLIFFHIYISKVLNKVVEISIWVTFLSLIDDLEFMFLGNLIKKAEKTLKTLLEKYWSGKSKTE